MWPSTIKQCDQTSIKHWFFWIHFLLKKLLFFWGVGGKVKLYFRVFGVFWGMCWSLWVFLWDTVSFSVFVDKFRNIWLIFDCSKISNSKNISFCIEMVLNGFPPIPIPSVSKSLLPGGKQIRKEHIADDFPWFLWKRQRESPARGLTCLSHVFNFFRFCQTNCFFQVLSKGGLQAKITKATIAVFPRVSKKKRESNNDDKYDHGQEEKRPSTLCWGKNVWARGPARHWKHNYKIDVNICTYQCCYFNMG